MISTIISHYKILEKLGAGGMGEVYLAEDTKLDRKVALKFLPPHASLDAAANARFQREAKAVAALNHPNIITVYEIGEHEGRAFIAMEYIKGQSLREKMKTATAPLLIDEVINIASQVCDGLAVAHQAGITHRDLKPENLMIAANGRVKILDFGLAKLKGVTKLTADATTLGTICYMSPEQARGEEVDHHTDIWSLGVVLYEMLTGQLPFRGEYEAAMMYSILNEAPKSPMTLRPDLPAHIETVIYKSLEKDQTRRYQNMQELLQDLRASFVSPTAEPKQEKSIVVLPFENMSPDPDQEYFSDGLTEEIITDLSQIRDLLVISRSSAMTLKGTKKKIREIAKEVSVRYVLEGSVRKAGNNLRITAQLIDAASDAHLWAEKYSGTLEDVFDIQEKVSRSIVDALKLKLSSEEKGKIVQRPIPNVVAYDHYLRARHGIYSFTAEGLERALDHLHNGLKIVGENALLLKGIGLVRFQQLNIGASTDKNLIGEIEECASRILDWDSEGPHGHLLYGMAEILKGDFRKSVKYLRRALNADPQDPETMFWLGIGSLSTGQTDFARQLFDILITIDPLAPLNHLAIGYSDFFRGRSADGVNSMRKAVRMGSDVPVIMWSAVRVFAAAGEIEEAFATAGQLQNEHPETMIARMTNAFVLALKGSKEQALGQLTVDLRDLAWHDCEWVQALAECYALVGEHDEAMSLLEHAVEGGFLNYPFLAEHDPFLEPLRGSERFKKLMERVKYEWENFEV